MFLMGGVFTETKPLQAKLSQAELERCRVFGHEQALSYREGRSEASKRAGIDPHGEIEEIHDKPEMLALGRAGELASVKALGLNETDLSPVAKTDPGYDFWLKSERVDVKASGFGSRFLFWPRMKNDYYHNKKFDLLVFATVDMETGEACVWGWVTKLEFWRQKRTAQDGHKLKAGTWFMDISDLNPMDLIHWPWSWHPELNFDEDCRQQAMKKNEY